MTKIHKYVHCKLLIYVLVHVYSNLNMWMDNVTSNIFMI